MLRLPEGAVAAQNRLHARVAGGVGDGQEEDVSVQKQVHFYA